MKIIYSNKLLIDLDSTLFVLLLDLLEIIIMKKSQK